MARLKVTLDRGENGSTVQRRRLAACLPREREMAQVEHTRDRVGGSRCIARRIHGSLANAALATVISLGCTDCGVSAPSV